MRVDVVTIFPDYLAPLRLSLIGRAVADGLLDVQVHDLRAAATDRHRTVDDTPYGGGAGMVMLAEPWASTVEQVRAGGLRDGQTGAPRIVVPSPSGRILTQEVAHELAAEPWLLLACGRYEGIDERFLDWARRQGRVSEVSIGDYVLFGGEAAALVILEATARLVPGVLGNPASLDEESHTDGLLDYPVYTRPAIWRDRPVPPVLLSGDHGAIAAWRHGQRLTRTRERRPDLPAPGP